MKIEKRGEDSAYYAERREALADVVEQREHRSGRPCPGCETRCTTCGSISCQCNCSPDCAQAPGALSSDPEKFPIEAGIVPLVYAMRETEIGEPCWSCEGHPDAEGRTDKLPQIWFYVRHQVYPDLLARYLWRLQFRGQIRNRWIVTVAPTDNSIDTTFAISPDPNSDKLDLSALRQDIRVIGERMPAELAELAKNGMEQIDEHIRKTREAGGQNKA